MRKVIATLSVASAILLTGCASSPWDGMPYQEANEWRGVGVTAHNAMQFRQNGFTPLDAKPWIQSGIYSPTTIVSWHQAGFTPQDAAKWQARGFTLQKAVELKKQGLTVE